MHVSGTPLVSLCCFQCVGCGAELSRIKVTLLVEKGYGVPYHRDCTLSPWSSVYSTEWGLLHSLLNSVLVATWKVGEGMMIHHDFLNSHFQWQIAIVDRVPVSEFCHFGQSLWLPFYYCFPLLRQWTTNQNNRRFSHFKEFCMCGKQATTKYQVWFQTFSSVTLVILIVNGDT